MKKNLQDELHAGFLEKLKELTLKNAENWKETKVKRQTEQADW